MAAKQNGKAAGKNGNRSSGDGMDFIAREGRVEKTQPMGYSADEACDVGSDTGSPASPDYGPSGNRFTGEIHWVKLDIGKDDHSHMISPEQRFNLAMARE